MTSRQQTHSQFQIETPRIPSPQPSEVSLEKIFLVTSLAIIVQFVEELKNQFVTSYITRLKVSFDCEQWIRLFSPICLVVIEPWIGYSSDNFSSKFGRRRIFIGVGSVTIAAAAVLFSYCLDIGDTFSHVLDNANMKNETGYIFLDISICMIQAPCKAFLGDLSGTNRFKLRKANAAYVLFLSVGSSLGYAVDRYELHMSFTKTTTCGTKCANLKSGLIISIPILLVLAILIAIFVKEIPTNTQHHDTNQSVIRGIRRSFKELPKSILILMGVTFISNVTWTPFLMYSSDWMGNEVFGGRTHLHMYKPGEQFGSQGMFILAVTMGFTTLLFEFITHLCRGGLNKIWCCSNLAVACYLSFTFFITKIAKFLRNYKEDGTLQEPGSVSKAVISIWFAAMGTPLAVSQWVPSVLTVIYATESGVELGFAEGVVGVTSAASNLLVIVTKTKFNKHFGGAGTQVPLFVAGSLLAAVNAIVCFFLLPSPSAHSELHNY